jgi:hypothetical protein
LVRADRGDGDISNGEVEPEGRLYDWQEEG